MQKILILVLTLFCQAGLAQTRVASFDTSGPIEIPMSRVLRHENIIKEQKRIDKLDGKVDQFINLSANDDINTQVTDVIYRKTDVMRYEIERMTADNNTKIGYLRSLHELLQAIGLNVKNKKKYCLLCR